MIDQFSPAQAMRQLAENSEALMRLTTKIIEARNAWLIAEAVFRDSYNEAYMKRSDEMKPTAAEKWAEIDSAEQKKDVRKAEVVLKNLQDQRAVIEISNNNLKMCMKLNEAEIKNLNL